MRRRQRTALLPFGIIAVLLVLSTWSCFTLREDGEDADAGNEAGQDSTFADQRGPDTGRDAPAETSPGLDDASQDAGEHDADSSVDTGPYDATLDSPAEAGMRDASADADSGMSDADADAAAVTAVPGCDLRGTQPGAAWPMGGYCPSHRHRSPFHGPHNGLSLAWTTPLTGPVAQSGVAIAADGTIYAPTTDGLFALDPDGGAVRWHFANGNYHDTPGITRDGTLRFGDVTGDVWLLAPDGSTIGLPVSLSNGTRTGPTIGGGGDLYFSDTSSSIDALAANGEGEWSVRAAGGNSDQSRPTITGDGTIVVGTDAPSVEALWPDGGVRWVDPFDASFTFASVSAAPVVAPDGTLIVAATGTGSSVHAFAPSDGKLLWSWSAGTVITGLSVGDDGTIAAALDSAGLQTLTPDGGVGAKVAAPNNCASPLLDADGWIFLACSGTGVLAIDPALNERWSLPLAAGQPWTVMDVMSLGADGTLYVSLSGLVNDAGVTYSTVMAVGD